MAPTHPLQAPRVLWENICDVACVRLDHTVLCQQPPAGVLVACTIWPSQIRDRSIVPGCIVQSFAGLEENALDSTSAPCSGATQCKKQYDVSHSEPLHALRLEAALN